MPLAHAYLGKPAPRSEHELFMSELSRQKRRQKTMPSVLLETRSTARAKEAPPPQPLHPIKREQIRDILKQQVVYGPSGNKVEEFFVLIDKNGDGTLEADELVDAVRDVFGILPNEISDAQIDALFKVLDDDGSGELELAELMGFITAAQLCPERGYRHMIRPQVSTVRAMCKVLQEAAEAREKGGDENSASTPGAGEPDSVGFQAADIIIGPDGSVKIKNPPPPPPEEKPKEEKKDAKKPSNSARGRSAPAASRTLGKSKVAQNSRRTDDNKTQRRDSDDQNDEQRLKAQEKARKVNQRREMQEAMERRAVLENKAALTQMLRDVIQTQW